jgi:hypothetical protein
MDGGWEMRDGRCGLRILFFFFTVFANAFHVLVGGIVFTTAPSS